MIQRPPRSTQSRSSAASDVYKRQGVWSALFSRVLDNCRDENPVKIEQSSHQLEGDHATLGVLDAIEQLRVVLDPIKDPLAHDQRVRRVASLLLEAGRGTPQVLDHTRGCAVPLDELVGASCA